MPSVTIRVRDTSGHPLPKGTVVTVRAGPAGRAPWIPHLLGADSTLLLRRWSDTVAINIPPTRGVDAAWATVGEVLDLGTPRGDAGELQVWEAINATFVLVDANGRPLIGAPVWIRRVPSPARHAPNVDIQARTDDAGRIQPFQDVARPLGDYEIRTHDRHVLWKGNISSDADREIRVAVDSKFVPVRATLSDHSGRMVSSRYVSAAVARPRERLRRPGPDFREGPVLTFIVERSRLADSVVRVEHKWQGVEDHAIGPSGEVNVRLSAEAGVVGIRLHGEQTPTRGLVVLALEQSATVRYEIPLPDRGKGIVFGVRPGQYSWRTLHTDLLSERSGGDLTVVPGKETDLLIR